MLARYLLALVADARQFFADRLAIDVLGRIGRLQRKRAAKHAGTHHHRHEARTFLIGPERNLDRRFGLDLQVVQRTHHFQPGQHAVVAIEFTAGRLGVDMTAGDYRRQRVVGAVAAHEDIADLVDRDRQPGRLGPANHQVAALLVQVRQGQPFDAPLGRGADLGQFHQRRPQAVAIDAQFVHVCTPRFRLPIPARRVDVRCSGPRPRPPSARRDGTPHCLRPAWCWGCRARCVLRIH